MTTPNAAEIFADGPSSSPNNPDKAKIREWGTMIERIASATTSATAFTVDGGSWNKLIAFTSASPVTATLAAGVDAGMAVILAQEGAGAVTAVAGSGATIAAFDGGVTTKGQYDAMIAYSLGSNKWRIYGGVAA